MMNQSRRRCVEPVETDEMILASKFIVTVIPKGCHDSGEIYDTPTGFVKTVKIAINISLPRSSI